MTLASRAKLITDMIRENPDTTIRQYLDLVADLEAIAGQVADQKTDDMNTPVKYTEQQADYMIKHAHRVTVRAMAKILDLDEPTVRNFGSRYKLKFLPEPTGKKCPRRPAEAPAPIFRPRAEYSNVGHLSVTKKYAS